MMKNNVKETPTFVIKDSGKRHQFKTGAQRDTQEGKGRFDLLPCHALTRLAQHFENGAKKYNDDNWRKGIPLNRYIDSAFRHLVKFMDGERDEDHAIAAAWNIMCLIETEYMINKGQLPAELNTLRKPYVEPVTETDHIDNYDTIDSYVGIPIILNGEKINVTKTVLSYEDIVDLYGKPKDIIYTVTYSKKNVSINSNGCLFPGGMVNVTPDMVIDCVFTGNA